MISEKVIKNSKPVNDKLPTTLSKGIAKTLKSQNYLEIAKMKSKFTDEVFPPADSSLYSGKTEFSKQPPQIPKFLQDSAQAKTQSQYALSLKDKKYVWKRLSDVFKPGELNILKEPPSMKEDPDVLCEDVIQGELGDCYFLSAISALAEVKERIFKLIPNNQFINAGAFEIVIYLHGEPTRVVIDDYFPFVEKSDLVPQPAFAGINSETKNIWPMILEKVWAKMNLSYEDIISGNSAEAFEFLVPAPIDTFYHDFHKDTLYDEIVLADQMNYIICADITFTENSNLNYLSKMGLITNHAYTVIDTGNLTDPTGKKIRLLKIRNPWGTNEWTGDWSDKSSKWTPQYKKLLHYEDKEDGTYWMAYEDFIKFYTSTHICRIHDDFFFVSNKCPVDTNKRFSLVKVDIPKDTSGFFIVNLKNKRIYRNFKGNKDYENRYCSLTVFKLEGKEMIYIGSTCGRDNRLYVECRNMVKGTYIISVSFPKKGSHVFMVDDISKVSIASQDETTYQVGVYSPFSKLDMIAVPEKDYAQLATFIGKIIYQLAKANSNNYHFIEEGEKDSWRSISFEKDAGAFGYIFYENNSDGFIHEHVTFSQFTNVNLIPMMQNGDKSRLSINEDAIEDPNTRAAIEYLKSNTQLDSKVTIITAIPDTKEITADTPLELMLEIAPKSTCTLLIEKFDEDSGIEVNSRISLIYPTYALLSETKFQPKKTRLKYNTKLVEIYECIVEHNSGVMFIYKNKTKDLKVATQIKFPEMENLKLGLKSDTLGLAEKKKIPEKKSIKEGPEFIIDDNSREVVLTLEPGETKFFELNAIDIFESFSYSCQMNYIINLALSQMVGKFE